MMKIKGTHSRKYVFWVTHLKYEIIIDSIIIGSIESRSNFSQMVLLNEFGKNQEGILSLSMSLRVTNPSFLLKIDSIFCNLLFLSFALYFILFNVFLQVYIIKVIVFHNMHRSNKKQVYQHETQCGENRLAIFRASPL